MKNKKALNNSNEKKEDDKLKKNDLVNPNEIASISNLWQQYSPMVWSEMYNEYINYTRRMTEIYNEYAKSSQRMSFDLYLVIRPNISPILDFGICD